MYTLSSGNISAVWYSGTLNSKNKRLFSIRHCTIYGLKGIYYLVLFQACLIICYVNLSSHVHVFTKKLIVLIDKISTNCIVFCVAFFSKRWLVYAAGTNSDVCARNYLYPVFLLTKTQPRGFHQWIFIKETPLPDWQGFCKCVLFEIICWGSTIYVSHIFIE